MIFEPVVSEGYEWINCVRESDYEIFSRLDGSSRAATWPRVLVRRVRADEHHDFRASDFPWLGSDALVMRRKAVDALRPVLEGHGELLPLETEDGVELFAFNAAVVDALDEERSSVLRFPQSNRIMRVMKYVFRPLVIENVDVFRLPFRGSSTFVSKRFIDHVTAAHLTGLKFNQVWSERAE